MAIRTYIDEDGVWADGTLKTNEIEGARENADCARIYVNGAWEDVWNASLSIVENGEVQGDWLNEIIEVGVDYQTTYAKTLIPINPILRYSDATATAYVNAFLEYQNGSGERYYFDVSNYDTLVLDIAYAYDYYQCYSNSYWHTNNSFRVIDENGSVIDKLYNTSGSIDISQYNKVAIQLLISTSLQYDHEEDYFNGMTVTINTLRFE